TPVGIPAGGGGPPGWPTGPRGTPAPALRSARSCGAPTRTSAQSARNRTACLTSGSTLPRPPYVDNNTRISCLPFRSSGASGGDYAVRPGACYKPPGALYIGGGERHVLSVLKPSARAPGQT